MDMMTLSFGVRADPSLPRKPCDGQMRAHGGGQLRCVVSPHRRVLCRETGVRPHFSKRKAALRHVLSSKTEAP